MKKIFPLILVPLLSLFSVSAQITQAEADSIVKERMNGETKPYTIYAKESAQAGFEITTIANEALELDYSCWIYYINFTEEVNGKYLMVKESNGNILEINTRNDENPDDLAAWRVVMGIIPFVEYPLFDSFCVWTNLSYYGPHPGYLHPHLQVINSNEELEQYVSCAEGSYPKIDFSKHTLLLVSGIVRKGLPIVSICKNLLQLSANNFRLDVELQLFGRPNINSFTLECWGFAILTSKMDEESNIAINLTNTTTSCELMNIPASLYGNLTIINSQSEMNHYIECTDAPAPEIDFTKHTLLIVGGFFYNNVWKTQNQLIKKGVNHYELDVAVWITSETEGDKWIVKLLIPKLAPDDIVSLNVHHPNWK